MNATLKAIRGLRGTPHRTRMPQLKGLVSPRLAIPPGILCPPYAHTGRVPSEFPPAQVHNADGISRMRAAGLAAAELLDFAGKLVVPGCTGDDIDRRFHEEVCRRHLYPSPLNYAGFPKSICVSINEIVCHGIPDSTVLETGDLVKLDVSVFLEGYHGDTCRTFVVGGKAAADARAAALVAVTRRSLNAAIRICGPGVPVSAIGDTIQPILTEHGLMPVREYAGHGIGNAFHTLPLVWHYSTAPGKGTAAAATRSSAPTLRQLQQVRQPVLKEGMTFTIEPMVVEGDPAIHMWPDGWAVATVDRGWAAQFEHTLLVTPHGVDILTPYDGMLEDDGASGPGMTPPPPPPAATTGGSRGPSQSGRR
jgi:methionyl aminopeptidase